MKINVGEYYKMVFDGTEYRYKMILKVIYIDGSTLRVKVLYDDDERMERNWTGRELREGPSFLEGNDRTKITKISKKDIYMEML